MPPIGFSIDDIIADMEKNKKRDRKAPKSNPELKIQRLGPGYFEFYLQDPVH